MTEDLQIACPEAEQLAEYIEGRLNASGRARIESHLADCELCREVVAQTVQIEEEASPATPIPFWRQPAVRATGGLLALAASLLLVVQVRPQLNPFRGPTTYDELIAAVGTNRTVEGRLSGFQYGPLRSPTRSAASGAADYGVLAAAAKLQEDAQSNPTTENVHALGVARLVMGDVDGGVDALQNAVDLEPGRADFQSDLAAALVARGRALQQAQDFTAAVAAADRAIQIDPAFTAGYFNRAVALDAIERNAVSEQAWRDYLQRDASSEWSAEGRRQLERE